ncbi:unnamed protein product [Effrenium voratum]|nr:unnamed protein product [Effrenium voratum]
MPDRLVPPLSLEGIQEPSSPLSSLPPLLVKGALTSLCIVGFWVTVRLMEEFGDVLKPLILAMMLTGCLERAVELCETAILRTISFFMCILLCRCNLHPLKKCLRMGRRPQPRNEGGYYVTLDLREEESCIPEDVLRDSYEAGSNCGARLLALGIVLFVSGLCLLEIFSAILSSLQQVNVQTYQKGFQQLEEKILGLLRDASPHFKEQLSKQLNSVESQFMSVAINVLNGVLSRTTSLFTQTVMFLLYVLMWLLSPMTSQSGQAVFSIVRTYFMYKAFCNTVFGNTRGVHMGVQKVGDWMASWLCGLGCDLAMVVAVMCFFLGFIPEVGSVISVVVPVPILLFDSRVSLEVRATNVLTMAVGMLLIKFMVSNGLESYLMSKSPTLAGQREGENQPASETHPVIILFVVILCGEIWGITGMLISVPLLALIRLLINLENTHPGRVTAAAAASAKAVVPSVNPTPRKTSGASASYVSEVARNESLNGRRNSKIVQAGP